MNYTRQNNFHWFLMVYILFFVDANAEINCMAFDSVLKKAVDGDQESQYEVGKSYYYNLCGVSNYDEAIYWFQRSAAFLR